METITEKTTEVLNDLIQINNDRIEGYERAAKETDAEDKDLRSLFNNMAAESRKYKMGLISHLHPAEEPAKGTSLEGKIYRAWMDIKATFSGSSRKAILASCEFGEDAAQKAYKEAMAEDIPIDIRDLISKQQSMLEQSHDKIKRMRDMQHA